MMKDIAIFGAGGLGKETTLLINLLIKQGNEWHFIGYFDDAKPKGLKVSQYGDCLGGIGEINAWPNELDLVIAIGCPESVKGVRERIVNKRISFPNLVAPTATIADPDTFTIGEGNILGGGTYVSCDVKIGGFNLFNGDVVMGHDVSIGNYNIFMPDIRVSGEVTIGDCNLLGVGSIILQQLRIGEGVHLGAGTVLMTKPKDNSTYLGNPAKLFKY